MKCTNYKEIKKQVFKKTTKKRKSSVRFPFFMIYYKNEIGITN